MRNVFTPPKQEKESQLTMAVSYEILEQQVPEVKAMKGYDQKHNFHALSLDAHTKEVARYLADDEFIQTLDSDIQAVIKIAAFLHDIGKVSQNGHQVNRNDPTRRTYIGHERESKKRAQIILNRNFNISNVYQEVIIKLIELHTMAVTMIDNFGKNDTPAKGQLKSYSTVINKVKKINIDISVESKVKILIAFARADILAGFNKDSDDGLDKVKKIKELAEKLVEALTRFEKAIPAFLSAVEGVNNGNTRGEIIIKNGNYEYNPNKKIKMPKELIPLSKILQDKMPEVARIYDELQDLYNLKDKEKIEKYVNETLVIELGLTSEQVSAVLATLVS